jgi:hypothetical protein
VLFSWIPAGTGGQLIGAGRDAGWNVAIGARGHPPETKDSLDALAIAGLPRVTSFAANSPPPTWPVAGSSLAPENPTQRQN